MRGFFNRELVSLVLRVCLLESGVNKFFSWMYGSKWSLNFTQVSQWQTSFIENKNSNGNKVPVPTKVPMTTKFPMATNVPMVTNVSMATKCVNTRNFSVIRNSMKNLDLQTPQYF